VWLNHLRKLFGYRNPQWGHRQAGRRRRRATTRPQLEALANRLAPAISSTSGSTTAFISGSSGSFTVHTSGSNQTDPVAGVGAGNAPPVVAFSHTRNTLPQSLTAPVSGFRGGPASPRRSVCVQGMTFLLARGLDPERR
jgi:hypothetical protein